MHTESIAILEQIITEDTYSKYNNYKRIMDDIAEGLEAPIEHAIDLIIDYCLGDYYKAKNESIAEVRKLNPRTIVNEIIRTVIPFQEAVPFQMAVENVVKLLSIDSLYHSLKTAAELVAVVCESNLYDIIAASDSDSGSLMIRSNYSLSKEVLHKIDKTKYLPPMVTPPELITNNRSSGYLTKNESVILGKANHHEDKLSLDVLNMLNQVKLSLDVRSLEYEETSKKALNTKEKRDNHRLMADSSTEVYNELLEKGNEFYITWRYCKRGRAHCSGYHVSVQGTDYKKSLLNLAKKELITGAY